MALSNSGEGVSGIGRISEDRGRKNGNQQLCASCATALYAGRSGGEREKRMRTGKTKYRRSQTWVSTVLMMAAQVLYGQVKKCVLQLIRNVSNVNFNAKIEMHITVLLGLRSKLLFFGVLQIWIEQRRA